MIGRLPAIPTCTIVLVLAAAPWLVGCGGSQGASEDPGDTAPDSRQATDVEIQGLPDGGADGVDSVAPEDSLPPEDVAGEHVGPPEVQADAPGPDQLEEVSVPESVSVSVGESGATLELPGGGLLEVPAGALAEEITLVVTVIDAPTGEPFVPLGSFYSFAPDGTLFAIPVLVTMPLSPGALTDPHVFGLGAAWRGAGEPWELLDAKLTGDGAALSVAVTHFSEGGPVVWPAGCQDVSDCGAPKCAADGALLEPACLDRSSSEF